MAGCECILDTYLYQKVTSAKSNAKIHETQISNQQEVFKLAKMYQLRGFQHNSSCFAKLEPQMAAASPYLQKE